MASTNRSHGSLLGGRLREHQDGLNNRHRHRAMLFQTKCRIGYRKIGNAIREAVGVVERRASGEEPRFLMGKFDVVVTSHCYCLSAPER